MIDYGDSLVPSPDLASILGLQTGDAEKSQCYFVSLAAAFAPANPEAESTEGVSADAVPGPGPCSHCGHKLYQASRGAPSRFFCRRCSAPWPTSIPPRSDEEAAPLPPLPSRAEVARVARALRGSAAAVAQWWLSRLGPPQFPMQKGRTPDALPRRPQAPP